MILAIIPPIICGMLFLRKATSSSLLLYKHGVVFVTQSVAFQWHSVYRTLNRQLYGIQCHIYCKRCETSLKAGLFYSSATSSADSRQRLVISVWSHLEGTRQTMAPYTPGKTRPPPDGSSTHLIGCMSFGVRPKADKNKVCFVFSSSIFTSF